MNRILPFLLLPAVLVADDLAKASVHQQTAIAELIQSLKSTQTILIRSTGSGEKKPPNPFRDKQEFKMPPMPDRENPDRRMADLIDRQEKLIPKMKVPSSDSQELAGEQRKLRKDASELAKKNGGGSMKTAESSMKEAEKMLESDKKTHAALAAQKAVSALKRARKEHGEKADRRMKKSLAEAHRKLSEAMKGSRMELANAMKELSRDLLDEAMNQHKSGKQEYAKSLSRLAEKADRGAKARELREFAEELSGELETLRLLDRSPAEILQTGTHRLRELGKQLKYSAIHPETVTPMEHRELRREIRMELDDARLALTQLLRTNGKDESAEAALRSAVRALKTESAYPAAHGNGAGCAASSALAGEIADFVAAAEKVLNRIQISGNVYVFNPDDVPARYRKEVGDYFKRLSEKQREGKK